MRTPLRPSTLALPALLSLVACASAGPRLPVAVVQGGDAELESRARQMLSNSPDILVDLRFVPAPTAVAAPEPDPAARVIEAKNAWVNGEYSACVRAVENDEELAALLLARKREIGARLIFWRAACLLGLNDLERAGQEADRLAAMELDDPVDTGMLRPEVDAFIDRRMLGFDRKRVQVRFSSRSGAGEVVVDGGAHTCALPCELELLPGKHFVALEGEGLSTEWTWSAIKADSSIELTGAAAPPEVAATQWATRYGPKRDYASSASLLLLSKSIAAQRLIVLRHGRTGAATTLEGAILREGVDVARERRTFPNGLQAGEVVFFVNDLLEKIDAPTPAAWYELPAFWIPISLLAAGAAAGITAGVLYEREVQTNLELTLR